LAPLPEVRVGVYGHVHAVQLADGAAADVKARCPAFNYSGASGAPPAAGVVELSDRARGHELRVDAGEEESQRREAAVQWHGRRGRVLVSCVVLREFC